MKRNKIEVYSYKGGRTSLWTKILIGIVLAGILLFSASLGIVLSGAHDHVVGTPDVMIVLGCQVKESGPSMLLQDRLDEALAYLNNRPDMTVVVSGGQGADEPVSEAVAMANYLVEHGVEEEQIIQETSSHNTAQNFQYTMEHLKEQNVDLSQGVLVVSNGFHLTRAKMLAQRAGFENISVLAAPASHVPSRLQMYLREPLALVKSFLFDR